MEYRPGLFRNPLRFLNCPLDRPFDWQETRSQESARSGGAEFAQPVVIHPPTLTLIFHIRSGPELETKQAQGKSPQL